MFNLDYISRTKKLILPRKGFAGSSHESPGHLLCCAGRVQYPDNLGRNVESPWIIPGCCAPGHYFPYVWHHPEFSLVVVCNLRIAL